MSRIDGRSDEALQLLTKKSRQSTSESPQTEKPDKISLGMKRAGRFCRTD
jgi:hypothetical protein